MKRTEVAMIILVASLSMLLTFTLAKTLLGDKVQRSAKVEQAREVAKDIDQPAKRVFNQTAINPTVEVCVERGDGVGESNCTSEPSQVLMLPGEERDDTSSASSTDSISTATTPQSGAQSNRNTNGN